MGTKIGNWKTVEREYVEGIRDKGEYPIFPSVNDLAKKYGVPARTIQYHCAEDSWLKKRTEFLAEIEKQNKEKHIKSFTDESIKFDNKCYKIALSGIQDIEDKVNFFKELDAANSLNNDENKSHIKETLTIDFYDKAARTIERFQRIGRIALGLSPNNNESNPSYNNIKIISFSEGLDKVMKQIKSDPILLKKIQDDLSD